MKTIRLDYLQKAAQSKGDAYFSECISAGRIQGEFLTIEDADWEALAWKHQGLGDRIHHLLKPLVRWLDRWCGTRLSSCSGCAQRRQKLNQLGRKLTSRLK